MLLFAGQPPPAPAPAPPRPAGRPRPAAPPARRALDTDGESVPNLATEAAPGHAVERVGKTDGAVGFARAEQLIFEQTATQVDDVLERGAATPIATVIAIRGITETQDGEVLIKGVAIAVETDVGEHRVGDGLREGQRLGTGPVKGDDVRAGRDVVDLGAGVRRSGGVSPDQYVASSVLVIIYATAGLEEGNPLRVGVGHVDSTGRGSDDALRL